MLQERDALSASGLPVLTKKLSQWYLSTAEPPPRKEDKTYFGMEMKEKITVKKKKWKAFISKGRASAGGSGQGEAV